MTNRQLIERKLEKENLTIGCYDSTMDKLSKKELNKVLDNLSFDNDIDVSINRKKHIVEVAFVDNEVDLTVKTASEYTNTYGNNK